VSLTPNAWKSAIKVEFLCEYDEHFKKALAHESGAQWRIVWWKKSKAENLVTLSL
jgi:hypothetical protein